MQRLTWALALTAMAAVSAPRPMQGQNDAGLGLQTVRYYRGGGAGGSASGGQTVVDVFCRVPLLLVNPIDAGGGGAFRFRAVVKDSAGLELVTRSWLENIGAEVLRTRGASTVEQLSFAARPGRYLIEVSVTDSATGRVERRQATLDAFGPAPAPAASDLLLATDVRAMTGPGDTVTGSGEVRKGPLIMTTTGHPVLTPVATKLGYYLELYPAQPETVSVAVRVLSDSGKQVVAIPPAPLAVGAGGGFSHGVLDLAGLPAGSFQLEVTATGPGFQVSRTAGFGMSGLETISTAAATVAAAEWPAGLTETQLDSMYAPLDVLMTADERGVYSTLTLEGKVAWLRKFWSKRDPTPGTPANEERDRFYNLIREVNRRFYEGGSSKRPGWSTDRGRIYLKQGGPPDEVYSRKVSASGNPYEVWRYTRSRGLTYIFMDLTRFGNYTLIYTNDRTEASRPGWDTLLGPDALRDLELQP